MSVPMSRPRPRALMLANRLPFPLDDGWKVRTFHVLRALAERYDTTLLSFHTGEADVPAGLRAAIGAPLNVVCVAPPPAYTPRQLLLGLLSPDPVHVWNQRSPEFAAALDRIAAEAPPDVAVAELTFMAPYLRRLPRQTLRVIDTHNVDSVVLRRYAASMTLHRRWYAGVTARKLEGFEARILREVDQTWVCSDAEQELLAGLGHRNVTVVPNGVATDHFAPNGTRPVRGRLLFFGRLDYYPNADALRFLAAEIIPALRRRGAEVEIQVVGQGAGDELRALVAANPELRLVGRVDDVRQALHAASVVIVPLRVGGGTRLKILEALAAARPIVSTRIGAEGLEVRDGATILLRDDAESFAEATLALDARPEVAEPIGAAGRELAVARYDWRAIGEQIGELLARRA